MADVNRGNRPLSPHLTIYRWPMTMMMSIAHRITGIGLTLGALLIVWWLSAAASGPEYFADVDGFLTSWLGLLLLVPSLLAFWFHFFNGIRHLMWDVGYGLQMPEVARSGVAALVATAILFVLTLLIA